MWLAWLLGCCPSIVPGSTGRDLPEGCSMNLTYETPTPDTFAPDRTPAEATTPAIDEAAASGTSPSPAPEGDAFPPGMFLNRELTWLSFNRRVLFEAQSRSNLL